MAGNKRRRSRDFTKLAARHQEPLRQPPRRRRVAIVVIGLLLPLSAMGAVALGALMARRSVAPPKGASVPTPAGKAAGASSAQIRTESAPPLSKEYIYAGGRLIATDEPQSGCTYPLNRQNISISSAASSNSFQVNTQTGCGPWTASDPDTSFVTITSPTGTVTGPGTVNFTVAVNSSSSRSSNILIKDQNQTTVATFTINQSGSGANYVGYLDHWGCDSLSGWAADRNRLNTSINVEIYDGATLLQTVLANQSRPDVGNFLGDNGLHGFSVTTPAALRDGNPHTVHVEFETSTTDLTNSPATLNNCSAANYIGYVDHAGCDYISGWAADRNRLNTSINVEVYDGTTLLQTVLASQSRPDVGSYLGDNGLHGFNIPPPAALRDGNSHTVHVKFETSATELNNSPTTNISFCPAVNYIGWLDHAGCDNIRGWAADRNRLNTSINVQIYDGTTLITTVLANQSRPDVGTYLGDNGLHGFNIATPNSLLDGASHTVHVKFETSTTELNNSPAASFSCSSNPAPQITPPLSPSSVAVGASGAQIQINGTGFMASSTVQIGANTRTPSSWTSTSLTVVLQPADVASPGPETVTVTNPAPGGGTSSAVTLTVNPSGYPICPTVSTYSGNGTPAYQEGTGSGAEWQYPIGGVVARDPISSYNSLFIADFNNNRIRQIFLEGPNSGMSQFVAGAGFAGDNNKQNPLLALYDGPRSLAAATDQNGVITTLYIADTYNHKIKTLKPVSMAWQANNFAGSGTPGNQDGQGVNAQFDNPCGITVGPDGFIYVADRDNQIIRKIDTNGNVTSLTSTGANTYPQGIAASKTSGKLYISLSAGHVIEVMNPDGSGQAWVAGTGVPGFNDGPGTSAQFYDPDQLAWANTGGPEVLFVGDAANNRVRILTISTSSVATFAGSGVSGSADGSCTAAQFWAPTGVAVGVSTEVYVMDSLNNKVRKLQ